MNNIWNVLEEAKNMKSTNIGKRITPEDLNCVWGQISQYIMKSLQKQRCVIMKEVGTFTLQKWKLVAGIQHEVEVCRPMFFLSHALMEEYDIHQRKEHATDSIPVTVLNLSEITKSCNHSKETAMLCLDEIIQCLRQLIADGKNIKLEFPLLGELRIVQTTATFIFFEELKPDKKIPEKVCYRYESAIQPYIKKKIYPCLLHKGVISEES